MTEKENQNWKKISEDISKVTKKVKGTIDDQNIVDDLKDSLIESIHNTSKLLSTIVEKVDSTIKEDEIKNETKATIRCIPFDEKPENLRCVYSGEPAQHEVIYAKAY